MRLCLESPLCRPLRFLCRGSGQALHIGGSQKVVPICHFTARQLLRVRRLLGHLEQVHISRGPRPLQRHQLHVPPEVLRRQLRQRQPVHVLRVPPHPLGPTVVMEVAPKLRDLRSGCPAAHVCHPEGNVVALRAICNNHTDRGGLSRAHRVCAIPLDMVLDGVLQELQEDELHVRRDLHEGRVVVRVTVHFHLRLDTNAGLAVPAGLCNCNIGDVPCLHIQ
mmetsp:Transcript_2677/g.4302  ORF Transcript_2677/g.4302 Transcript_2677/m.4302 type:complete len:221 (-) Transcript_2677:758-1420(-)